MRVLFVAPYVPSRVRVRPLGWLQALAGLGHRVHLIALRPPEDRWAAIEPLAALCDRIDIVPLSRGRTLWNMAAALPGATPFQAAYARHGEARRLIATSIESDRPDVVHVEHLRAAALVGGDQRIPGVFDAVDSISALFAQAARRAPSLRQRVMARADLGRTRAFERGLLRRFDRVLVTSPAEAAAFGELDPSSARERVAVIPNGVDLEYFQPRRDAVDPATIVFSGKLSYHANVAAGLWLAQRIMPLVWKKRPDATLVLAGKDPAPALVSLGRDPRVKLTGFLDDLRPVFARATVAAVPMVYGAGIQNKLLEAMASGVPVVASSVVASSLPLQPGRDLLLGDGTEALAVSLVEALDDGALRERLSRAGRAYVETHHDWIRLGALLIGAYEQARNHWYGSSMSASPAAFTQ